MEKTFGSILLICLVLMSGCTTKTEEKIITENSITTTSTEKTTTTSVIITTSTVPATNPPTTTLPLEDEANRYKNEEHDFSIVPPKGWTTKENEGNTVVAFFGPNEDGFTVNIGFKVVKLPYEISLEDFTESSKKGAANVSTFISERPRNINGLNAYELVSIYKPNPNLQMKQIYFLEKGYVYLITAATPKDKYGIYNPIFEESIQTFKIE